MWTAIVAALVWSYGAIAWRAVTGRRTSGLLILTAVLLTGRTALSFVADSTWLYFLQPVISDGIVAHAVPALARQRPADGGPPRRRLLPDGPRARDAPAGPAPLPHLTSLWAALGFAKATMTLWLLQSQSLETFVLVKSISMPAINVLAAFATIGLAALVARQEGLMGSTRPAPVPVEAPA